MSALRWSLIIALFAAWPSTALAEETGVLTRAPEVLQPVEPEYPAQAQAEGRSAEVTLAIDISETGEVLDAQILQGAGFGFDEAALAAARKLRFSPAEIDGKPAAVQIEYRFTFSLRPAEPEPAAPGESAAPVVNLSGRVLQRGSKKPIAGATVEALDPQHTATTDAEGRFEIAGLPEGEIPVVVVAVDHARFKTVETIQAGKRTEVTYYLRRVGLGAYETVVVGQKEKKDVATVALSVGEIRKIPGTSGDTVKVVQSLPGTARAPAGMGMLIVRGGGPRDTRTYVDGAEVPVLFHFGGLTSVYASELVRDVEYEPGNFGARYGRATAGRVEIKTRDPNTDRLHFVLRADFIDALAMAEGPLSDTVSGAFALRRSYVDGLLNLAYKAGPDEPGFAVAPRYYDYQGKLVWKPGTRDTVRFDVYGSDDKLEMVGLDLGSVDDINKARLHTRFTQVGASWDHRFDERTRSQLRLAHVIGASVASFGRILDDERWHQTTLRAEVSHDLADSLTLATGLDLVWTPRADVTVSAPPIPNPGQIPNPDHEPYLTMDKRFRNFRPGAWVEATWKPLPNVTLVPGLRVDSDAFHKAAWLDPRLAARWALTDATALKAGVGLYHQPPFIVYAMEEWGNPAIGPEKAWQYSAGIEQQIAGPVWLDLQVYFKRLLDLVQESDPSERFNNRGSGKAYGAEVLLRYKPDARFFGWVAYSYSRSLLDQTVLGYRFDGVGADFDQPHNLIAVGSLALPEIWNGLSVGLKLRYTSGNPYRPSSNAVYDVDGDQWQSIPGLTTRRMPAFFQADLRVDKMWTFKTWTFTAYIDVQNITNRGNVEGLTYAHDYSAHGWSTGLPILPSLGLRAEY